MIDSQGYGYQASLSVSFLIPCMIVPWWLGAEKRVLKPRASVL
jgi:hypothetical protein